MLPGFEKETHEITDLEEVYVPEFIKLLKEKIGSENAIKNHELILHFSRFKIREARVRKIINHIRTKELILGLIATSKGYFITDDKKQLERYISSLKGRESEIRRVRESMERYLNTL